MSADLGPEGAGVRITGFVERKFTPPSRKCCFVTVSFPGEMPGKRTKVDVVAFSENVEAADALGQGEKVTITAGLGNKKLTNKAKQDVEVDGRAVWTIQLVVRSIKTEGTKQAPPAPKEPPKPGAQLPGDTVDW